MAWADVRHVRWRPKWSRIYWTCCKCFAVVLATLSRHLRALVITTITMENLAVFVSVFLVTTIWYFSSFPKHYGWARKTGLPIFLSPVDPSNPLWMIFSTAFEPVLARFLPPVLYDRIGPTIYGWEYRYRYALHAKLGPAFVMVTPAGIDAWIADAEMANRILVKRVEFPPMDMSIRIMGYFGQNLSSSIGSDWQRHRKIVAPVLNERIMGIVWNESVMQAKDMIEAFAHTDFPEHEAGERQDATNFTDVAKDVNTDNIVEGVRRIAINVIQAATYGTRSRWSNMSHDRGPNLGYQLSFVDSMLAIVQNHIIAVFIPPWILCSWWMPHSIRQIGVAALEFPRHSNDIIAEARQSVDARATMVNALVKEADREDGALTSAEIIGNLFNFMVAGFDTNASTMAYAVIILAIEEHWQSWIAEEIDRVAEIDRHAGYSQTFPQLVRCLALMYETVRLYPPVTRIVRCTKSAQALPNRNHHFPAGTNIVLNTTGIHVSPDLYGPDPLAFRPTRWISSYLDGNGTETFVQPAKGTLLAWSSGPRVCPGMKMAQVEFVAVFREILSKWRIQPVVKNGETLDLARERLIKMIQQSQPKMTLQVRNPKDVLLQLVPR